MGNGEHHGTILLKLLQGFPILWREHVGFLWSYLSDPCEKASIVTTIVAFPALQQADRETCTFGQEHQGVIVCYNFAVTNQ